MDDDFIYHGLNNGFYWGWFMTLGIPLFDTFMLNLPVYQITLW